MNRNRLIGVFACLIITISASPAFATYGGDNGKIAFVKSQKIVSQAPGGGADKVLAQGTVSAPSYSRSGAKIVFLKNVVLGGFPDPYSRNIWIMNADGSGEKKVTKTAGQYWNPSFSRSGSLILFSQYDGNPQGIRRLHTIRLDGTGKTEFARNVGGSMDQGVWSPDGTKVAYVGGPTGANQVLRTINSEGRPASVTSIAPSLSSAWAPDWSPNSRAIVFVHSPNTGNTRVIYRVNADKSGLVKLADYGEDMGADEPVWSPDGNRIVFDKQDYDPGTFLGIWTMRAANGADKTQVDSSGFAPAWQPR